MSHLYDRMIRFFENEGGWVYKPFADVQALRLPFKGDSAAWACIAQTQEENRLFLFYSICPKKVTPENHLAVTEFITRANYDMPIGNFEMDWTEGEVRFKTSVGLGPLDWSDELIRVAVYTNLFSMNQYIAPLFQVMAGRLLPQEAIDLAEISDE